MSSVTLTSLNANDNVTEVGGIMLGNDGQGNQLWQFGEKVANRYQDSESGAIWWSDEIEGWNYSSDDAIAA